MKKEAKIPLHRRIRHAVHKYHKIRKVKEENLQPWKKKWNEFNEVNLGWLEHLVDKAIPWLVLGLLVIIVGEFSGYLNFFNSTWIDNVSKFFENNQSHIQMIDHIIVSFFVADLYFNFFKKRSFWTFLKTSILDIIAIAPLGLIFRLTGFEVSPMVAREIEAAGAISKENVAARLLKAEELVKIERLEKITKIPRFFRLHRITDFFKGKKKKKK